MELVDVFANINVVVEDKNFWIGIIVIPICWLILYLMAGAYRNVYSKSRVRELGQTFITTLIGAIVLFFTLILDDYITNYKIYYTLFSILFLLQFSLTYIGRLVITTITARKIHNGTIGFNTLIIGSNGNACAIYKEITGQKFSSGNIIVGFVNVFDKDVYKVEKYIPHLGNYKDVAQVIKDNDIEEVIIAIERSETETIDRILVMLEGACVWRRQAGRYLACRVDSDYAGAYAGMAAGGKTRLRHSGVNPRDNNPFTCISLYCENGETLVAGTCLLQTGTYRTAWRAV